MFTTADSDISVIVKIGLALLMRLQDIVLEEKLLASSSTEFKEKNVKDACYHILILC